MTRGKGRREERRGVKEMAEKIWEIHEREQKKREREGRAKPNTPRHTEPLFLTIGEDVGSVLQQ